MKKKKRMINYIDDNDDEDEEINVVDIDIVNNGLEMEE
jgi:hypothetical protein